jgi:hypothetical protein
MVLHTLEDISRIFQYNDMNIRLIEGDSGKGVGGCVAEEGRK